MRKKKVRILNKLIFILSITLLLISCNRKETKDIGRKDKDKITFMIKKDISILTQYFSELNKTKDRNSE